MPACIVDENATEKVEGQMSQETILAKRSSSVSFARIGRSNLSNGRVSLLDLVGLVVTEAACDGLVRTLEEP